MKSIYENNSLCIFSGTYKCGVFFEDLRDNKPLTWLGALPDALKKVDKDEYQEILGENITPDSFKNLNCDNTTIAAISANARCYTTVQCDIPKEKKYL